MNKRILITGSSGYIGRNLYPFLLKLGYDVLGLDKEASATCDVILDLRLRKQVNNFFRDTEFDVIIHMAAETDTINRDQSIHGANIEMASNICAAIKSAHTSRVINFSSMLAEPFDPQSKGFHPQTIYGFSKKNAETIFEQEMGRLTSLIHLRPTTVWGLDMDISRFTFMKHLSFGKLIFFPRSDHLFKSYATIEASLTNIWGALESKARGVHYLCDEVPLPVSSYVDWIAFRLSKKVVYLPFFKLNNFIFKVALKYIFPSKYRQYLNLIQEFQFQKLGCTGSSGLGNSE